MTALFSKQFDGWQAGALSVFLAVSVAVVVVPRAVIPTVLPEPLVSPNQMELVVRSDSVLVLQARTATRDGRVARLGAAYRELGRAEFDRQDDARQVALQTIVEMKKVSEDQPARLLELRAHQAENFVEAVRQFEHGAPLAVLAELGGALVRTMSESGWINEKERAVEPSPFELRAMFKIRWNSVAASKNQIFELSAVEHRALLRLCTRFPALPKGATRGDPTAQPFSDAWLLDRLPEFERTVPDYPFAFARGVLFYRAGRVEDATREFGLATGSNTGTLRLRAHNHLRASFAALSE